MPKKITLSKQCPFCGKTFTKEFDEDVLNRGKILQSHGFLMQNAFPTLTPSEREFLMTGICDTCWNKM